MKNILFYTPADTKMLTYARNYLRAWGYAVCDTPERQVTHVLLPVPSFHIDIPPILQDFSSDITVFGGGLPTLPVRAVDLLQDPYYTAENAAITAHCALGILLRELSCTLHGANILILGWGRIGKCLAQLLHNLGAEVTIAARKSEDRAMAGALGMKCTTLPPENWKNYTAVVNTIPAPILQSNDGDGQAFLLDLASQRGIDAPNAHWERGLPGRMAPASAGALLAKTVLRYALGKE